MRLFVTGAKGGVGSYVAGVFGDCELTLTDIDELDVTDAAAVLNAVRAAKPDAVLHLAAEIDVDRCEREPDRAYRINADGAENTARACKAAGAAMIYISTGAVFNGRANAAMTEYDAPDPANVYAKAKLKGEEAVARLVSDHRIVRAGWMIGGGVRDKKFVYKMLKLMNQRDSVKAVDDKYGTLTYGRDLLVQARACFESGTPGVYHAAHPGVVTRFDVAVELARLAGQDVEVLRCDSSEFPLPAPRSVSEAIENRRAEELGINTMRPWRDALAAYVRELESVGVLKDRMIRDL